MNVLWLLLDVTDVENLDLMVKLIFVQIVAIKLHVLVQVMEIDNTHNLMCLTKPIICCCIAGSELGLFTPGGVIITKNVG